MNNLFLLPTYHTYLLQLENYTVKRSLHVAVRDGFVVPGSFQFSNITWTKKLSLITLLAAVFTVGVPAGLLLLFPTSVSVVITAVLVFIVSASWFIVPLAVATLIVRPVDRVIRYWLKRKAKNKLDALTGTTVIGVTGSYGKTTMKQTLKTLLSGQLNVAATPESFNKPVSVARFIRRQVDADTDVAIIEMGAYQQGDITDLCTLAEPDIGVLCGINEAHLQRFGSMENTIQSKFEIVRNARDDALVVLNAGDSTVTDRFQEFMQDDQQAAFFSAQNDELCRYRIEEKRFHEDGSGWSARFYKDGEEIGYTKVPHLGEYILGNVMAGLIIGDRFDLDLDQVLKRSAHITPAERRLQPIQRTTDGILVIDDSYNGTLDGVKAALDTLDRFVGRRKVVVTTGLVETGEKTEDIHKQIGQRLAQTADVIVLVETSVTKWIKAGLESEDYSGEMYTFANRRKTQSAINDLTVSGDVVLFQNDWPENYR